VSEAILLTIVWLTVPPEIGRNLALLLAFVLGVAGWLWRATIRSSIPLTLLAAAGAAVALSFDAPLVGVALLAYAAVGLAWIPYRLEVDLSYGVYVLAYPTQELLATAGVPHFGLGVMVACSVGLSLLLASISWMLVERPALEWGRGIRFRQGAASASGTLALPAADPAIAAS
jgi:hypothetical protein